MLPHHNTHAKQEEEKKDTSQVTQKTNHQGIQFKKESNLTSSGLAQNKFLTLGSDVLRQCMQLTKYNKNICVEAKVEQKTLSVVDQIHFAQSHGWIHSIFKPDFKPVLLKCIVTGDQSGAEAIIKCYPEFLLTKGNIKNHTGQPICGTPYQIALAEKDFEMAKMIKAYFQELKNGEVERQKQYKEQFPEGWVRDFNHHWKPVYDALDRMVNILIHAQQNECQVGQHWQEIIVNQRIQNEFNRFQTVMHHVTRKQRSTGFHFDDRLLHKASELYRTHYVGLGDNYDAPKAMFFCQRIIGTLQRHSPANYLQAYAYGIYDIVKRDEKPARSFKFRYDNYFILPFNDQLEWVLGKNYFAGTLGAGILWAGPGSVGARRAWVESIAKYLAMKNDHFPQHFPRPIVNRAP